MMKRPLFALGAACVISFTMPLLAQSARDASRNYGDKDVTLTGCLQKNKSGGFWLTDAMVGEVNTAASTTTASPGSTTASTTTATGTTGTSAASTTTTDSKKDVKSATARGMWNLENGKDLDHYVNQKIQVTGRAKNSTSGDEVKGTTGREMDARDFDVKTVTLIASSCS
jgi:hypothetical protein